MTYTDGASIIATHPHRCFARVTAAGYCFRYQRDESGWTIQVIHGEEVLFSVRCFGAVSDPDRRQIYDIRVPKPHRRKGLANAVYVFAEVMTNGVLTPHWDQSADALALWTQRNRPFGNDPWWRKGQE